MSAIFSEVYFELDITNAVSLSEIYVMIKNPIVVYHHFSNGVNASKVTL